MAFAEFFPGRSRQAGSTICRGWLCPDGVQLVLPYSLVAVDPEQDRYSAASQLWRDAEGECWLISYNQAQQEWIGECLGDDLEAAKVLAEKARQAYANSRIRAAERILKSSAGKRIEAIWEELERESSRVQKSDLREDGGQLYVDVTFADGSAVRVRHPAGICRPGDDLIQVLVA